MNENNPENMKARDLIPVKGVLNYYKRNDNKFSFKYNIIESGLVYYNLGIGSVLSYGFWAGLDKILQ